MNSGLLKRESWQDAALSVNARLDQVYDECVITLLENLFSAQVICDLATALVQSCVGFTRGEARLLLSGRGEKARPRDATYPMLQVFSEFLSASGAWAPEGMPLSRAHLHRRHISSGKALRPKRLNNLETSQIHCTHSLQSILCTCGLWTPEGRSVS